VTGFPDRRYFARIATQTGFRAEPRGASYPAPSPADYSPEVVDRIRVSAWRSEVLALCRRPIPLTHDDARGRAASLLGELTNLSAGHRAFLFHLDAGTIRPDVLPHADLHTRIAANPGLLWRLREGSDGLVER
jgi:hypothetical protein